MVAIEFTCAPIGEKPVYAFLNGDEQPPAQNHMFSPRLIGETSASHTLDVCLNGSYAYLATTSGLQIFDISSPRMLKKVGEYRTNTGERALAVSVSETYAFVSFEREGLNIIDVSIPSTPVLVGQFNNISNQDGSYDNIKFAFSVDVKGSFAYIVDDFQGLMIINVSIPHTPTLVGHYKDTFGMIFADDSYVYVANDRIGLEIFDVSTPYAPIQVGFFDDNVSGPTCVFIQGNYAYIGYPVEHGIRIIDISTPSNPQLIGSFFDTFLRSHWWWRGIYVSGSYAYVVDGDDLEIIDISNPNNPKQVIQLDNLRDAHNVCVQNFFVYVGGEYGLDIIYPWMSPKSRYYSSIIVLYPELQIIVGVCFVFFVNLKYLVEDKKNH